MSIRLFLLLSLTSGLVFSQSGFLGHQNIIEFSSMINIPMLSGSLKEAEYASSDERMENHKDWLDYGMSFNYLHVNKKGRLLGFTSAIKCLDLSMPAYFISFNTVNDDHFSDTTFLRFQSLRYTNFYFAPRFEYTTKKGFAGIGLAYDIAAGVSISRIMNGYYAYSINEAGQDEDYWTETDYLLTDYDWQKLYGVFLQTGFKIRYPLNDRLLFNSGFHYTALFNLKPDSFEKGYTNDNIYLSEDLFFQLQRENLFTFNFDLGLSFTF